MVPVLRTKSKKNLASLRKSTLRWIRTSIWVFPVFLVILLVLLTVFKIHGSSVGVYHNFLYGKGQADADLIYGNPKPIRSDEWLIATQRAVGQIENNEPVFNEKIGTGRDLARTQDIPVRDWSAVFRPQTWVYFLLPFEYAFAFKWWSVLFLLMAAAYLFSLRILGSKRLLSVILSVSFALSPFLIWWYQATLFLSMSYMLIMLLISMRIIDQKKLFSTRTMAFSNIVYVIALSYLAISYAMILYPPFLISVALVGVTFLLGYIINKRKEGGLSLLELSRRLILFAVPLVLVLTASIVFVLQHKEMVQAVSKTVYPGNRISVSGDMPILGTLDSFMMPFLQSASRGANYYSNQSEASNFILLLPFLILPGLVLIYLRYKKERSIDYVFISLTALAVLFFTRAYIHFGDSFYRFLLLDRVPNKRMLAGLGFLGFIYLLVLLKKLSKMKSGSTRNKLAFAYSGLTGLILIMVAYYIQNQYPRFATEDAIFIGLALLFALIVFLLLIGRQMLAGTALLILTIASVFRIMPIYKEHDFLLRSEAVSTIKKVSSPNDKWAVLDSVTYENLPLVAGRGSVGGSQPYPDLEFWRQLDGGENEKAYNRQGHAVFSADQTLDQPITLAQTNVFKIKFSCGDFFTDNIDFVMSVSQQSFECLVPVAEVNYPKVTFYYYRMSK